ncbi:hypothetical protein BU17DRAFT_94488 [Hysterangium stoloniferum]|nr:hypothetical protein BU17DRAFT_94488 [Hysterangium stoloniferum]
MLQFIPPAFKVVALAATGCAIGTVITVPLTTTLLGAVGFSSGGVVAGSTAATIQSSYAGFVTSGSLFAIAQSAATGGAVLGAIQTVGAVLGVAGGVIPYMAAVAT